MPKAAKEPALEACIASVSLAEGLLRSSVRLGTAIVPTLLRRTGRAGLARDSVGAGRTKRLSWVGSIAAEPSGVRRLSTALLLNLRRFT